MRAGPRLRDAEPAAPPDAGPETSGHSLLLALSGQQSLLRVWSRRAALCRAEGGCAALTHTPPTRHADARAPWAVGAGPRPRAPSPSARADRPPSRSEPPGGTRTSSELLQQHPRVSPGTGDRRGPSPPPLPALPPRSGRDTALAPDLHGTALNAQTQHVKPANRSHGPGHGHGTAPQQWQSRRAGAVPRRKPRKHLG